jgi:HPt (histidine-containing phosphotransfer) domain-containing protein
MTDASSKSKNSAEAIADALLGPRMSRRDVLKLAGSSAALSAAPLAGHAAAIEQSTDSTNGVIASMRLNVNGTEHILSLDTRTTLLDALREHLHLTGTKDAITGSVARAPSSSMAAASTRVCLCA